TDVNEAPTAVSVTGAPGSLAENLDTATRVAVGSIVIADDALGSNAGSLGGADAALFEVDGTTLYLKAGAALDFETNPNLDVTVRSDERRVAKERRAPTTASIAVTDVNEPPTAVSVSRRTGSLEEDAEPATPGQEST